MMDGEFNHFLIRKRRGGERERWAQTICNIEYNLKILALNYTSVADPDPHVFGPSESISGSGSFYHHAKIVRKTLIPTIL
jgi:hypothetical protein